MTAGRWVLVLAIVAAMVLLLAGPGARAEFWDFRFGFTLMRWAVYMGAGVGVIALVMLFVKSQRQASLTALVAALAIAAITVYVPWSLLQTARSVPRIHDITTDVVMVPAFVDIVPLRADAPNPVAYPGTEVASQQLAAYPDIVTFQTSFSVEQVHQASRSLVEEFGWTEVANDPSQGRIEAYDTTFWFGFVDDVVIRIQSQDGLTEVDVRSKSRVGLSDVGKNAQRIREFLQALEQRLDQQAS